jgi:hypothetical protein
MDAAAKVAGHKSLDDLAQKSKKSKTAFDLSLRISLLRLRDGLTVLVNQLSTTAFTSSASVKLSEPEICSSSEVFTNGF